MKQYHPDEENDNDINHFEIEPSRTAKTVLERLASEGAELMQIVKEKNEKSKIGQSQLRIINSKLEFNQPMGLVEAKTNETDM